MMVEKIKLARGFILLELLVAITILLMLFSWYYTPSRQYVQSLYTKQLKIATQIFVADIRTFQQNTLFSDEKTNRIIILESKDGYILENNKGTKKRYVYFSQIGCQGIYFASYANAYIRFTNTGAPSNKVAGNYILKHRKNPRVTSTITIQVSSGRVDINEN